MKTDHLAVFLLILLLSGTSALAGQAPKALGGFRLGADIAAYKDRIRAETVLPLRYRESVNEVEIKDIPGFQSGVIWYGTCEHPGRILRIKLKYADSDKAFFEKLLKRFKQRFGEPGQWRGDPFHIVIAWKWAFTDENGNDISLILKHNTKDHDDKIGNSVKLTIWDWVNAESRCSESSRPQRAEPAESDPDRQPVDWDLLIPR